MDFSATIDLIIRELREAGEIIEDLKKYPGVPALQVELAKLKCRSAAECIAMLRTLNDGEPMIVTETPAPVKVQKTVPPPVIREPEPEHITSPAVIEERNPVPPPVEKPVAVARKKEHIVKPKEDAESIADRFVQSQESFHEQLAAGKTKEELADILQTKPISSLADVIGLAEKFIFIKEIFSGNQNDYSQAISRLESVTNVTDARAVIMSYTGDSSESEAINQLLELVKRKIPSDE
jgi:hypothetical protein